MNKDPKRRVPSVPLADAQFGSPDAAKRGLRARVPGSRNGRSSDEISGLLKAARKGVGVFHRERALQKFIAFSNELDNAVGRIRAPKFDDPPIPLLEQEQSSGDWADAASKAALAREYLNALTSISRAWHGIRKIAPSASALLLQHRDGVRVSMATYVLGHTFELGLADPEPVELALISVAIGLEPPLAEAGDDNDSSNRRRNAWGHTLRTAKTAAQKLMLWHPRR